jgi:O-antigen ligase
MYKLQRDVSVYKIFLFFIFLLLFSLPLSEAIKQSALFFVLIIGIYWVVTQEIIVEVDTAFNGAMSYMLASSVGIVVAQDTSGAFNGFLDVFKITLLFLIVRSVNFSQVRLASIITTLFISFHLALVLGLYHYLNHSNNYLELKSIGHVNHSAIYMAIIFAIAFSHICHKLQPKFNLWLITLVLSFMGLIISGSRAAIFSTIFICLIVLSAYLYCKKIPIKVFATLILGGLIICIFIIVWNSYSYHKILQRGFDLTGRHDLYISSLRFWFEQSWIHQLFGIGAKNSYLIDFQKYSPGGRLLGINDAVHVGHSHNTYITLLLEKGIVGVFSYICFISFVLVKLVKTSSKGYLTLAAIFIWWLNFIISLANTTFHDENALLMSIIWGLALNQSVEQRDCYS